MIDWRKVQERLGSGYSGIVDGDPGPLTWSAIVALAAPRQPAGSDAVTSRGRKLAEVGEDFDLTTPARIAGYLSNTAHETGDFTRLREDLFYRTAGAIRRNWPTRFANDAAAQPFVGRPEALANRVYARPREGNTQPGDGWRYRGGGDLQVTFRNGFRRAGAALGLPLEDHPELIETPAVAMLTGLAYWRDNRVNRFLDAGQPKRARALINAGNPDFATPIGWEDVERRHNSLLSVLA